MIGAGGVFATQMAVLVPAYLPVDMTGMPVFQDPGPVWHCMLITECETEGPFLCTVLQQSTGILFPLHEWPQPNCGPYLYWWDQNPVAIIP